MYEPIPGYSHLKLFLAPHRVRYGRLPTSAEVAAQHRIQGCVVFALDGVLLGAGDAAFLRTLTISSVLVGFLPGVILAHFMGTGLTGVWCGLAAFIAFRMVGVVYRFRSMKWAVVQEN